MATLVDDTDCSISFPIFSGRGFVELDMVSLAVHLSFCPRLQRLLIPPCTALYSIIDIPLLRCACKLKKRYPSLFIHITLHTRACCDVYAWSNPITCCLLRSFEMDSIVPTGLEL
jgi:hypothetical protein